MAKRKNKGLFRIGILSVTLILLIVVLMVLFSMLKDAEKRRGEPETYTEEVTEKTFKPEPTTEETTTEVTTTEEPTNEEPTTEKVNKDVDITAIEKLDDTFVPYGLGDDVDAKKRPNGCLWYGRQYSDYKADFIKDDDNKVYLTFIVKGEDGNTPKVLDILKQDGVKAVFFVTYNYVLDNPELVKRIIDEGHVLGHGSYMSGTMAEIYEKESEMHKYVLDKFDYEMYLFKMVTDGFTEQQMGLIDAMGYTNVFWSGSYNDWANPQPDAKESLNKLLDASHSGEILLLRSSSSTSLAILHDLISGLKAKGLDFGYYAKVE